MLITGVDLGTRVVLVRIPRPYAGRLAHRVCEALGLDAENVKRITLRFDPSEVVTAEVLMYVESDAGEELLEELRQ